ncbi:MAG: hypothetical protein ABIS47_14205 [Acidimicrobiales bacterium]
MQGLDPEEGVGSGGGGSGDAPAGRGSGSLGVEAAIRRAEAALALVVSDVVATTSVREVAGVERYVSREVSPRLRRLLGEEVARGRRWPEAPEAWRVPGGVDDGPVDDGPVDEDEVLLTCRFGGHWFLLHGDRSRAEMAVDIAFQVQDDVTMEVWGAWPPCPSHSHPMVAEAVSGEAVWRCPADGGLAVPIGRMGADRAR